MASIGTPLSPTATRVLLCGGGEPSALLPVILLTVFPGWLIDRL